MIKIKTDLILSLLITLSMLFYAIRGKIGALLITLFIFIFIIYLIKNGKNINKSFSSFYAIFILVFALIFGISRNINFEFYLFIGYFAAVLLLLNNNLNVYDKVWNILGKISLFEAFGIFMQKLFPNIYYSLISIVLPSNVVSSIKNRLVEGYYTGFTREVSFTMFFIVIGLGIYLFDILKKDKENIDSNYKIKKYFKILFLFAALVVSGKRATLIFFLLTIFIIQFIRSKDSLKTMKYLGIGCGLLLLLYISFPLWSKIESLSRIVELLTFIKEKNIIGITNGRNLIYQNAIDLWNTNRIFGIGWGNFKYMVNGALWYAGFDVHNCYLQILCENGLIGAAVFYTLTIISIFRFVKCLKKARECGDGYIYKLSLITAYVQIFFITYSFTEPILYEYTDYIIYFISINITNLLLYKLETKKDEKVLV